MIPVVRSEDTAVPQSARLAGYSTTAQFWPEISTLGRTDGATAGRAGVLRPETVRGQTDCQGTVQSSSDNISLHKQNNS